MWLKITFDRADKTTSQTLLASPGDEVWLLVSDETLSDK
jgi:hypothetical protein